MAERQPEAVLWPLAGGVLALAIAMGVGRFAYTPLLPAMQAGTGLSDSAAGLLASFNYAGYFVGALAAGAVPSGRPRRSVFRFCLLVSVATTAAMAATSALPVWAALRLASGVASAGLLILGSAMVLDRLGRAGAEHLSGVLFSGVGLGIAGSGTLVALLGGSLDWRGQWLVLGALCAGLMIPVWAWVTDRTAAGAKAASGVPAPSARSAAFLPMLLAAAYFCEGAGYIVTGTFLVAILKRVPELAPFAGMAWIAVGVAAAPSALLWAALGRAWGSWRALVIAHAVQAFGILLPVAGGGAAAAIGGAVLFGGTFMGITTLALALGRRLAERQGGQHSGRIIGMLTAAFALGQIIGPLPVGPIVERTGRFDAALVAAAGCVLFGAVLLAAGGLFARSTAE